MAEDQDVATRHSGSMGTEEQKKAAKIIQRNYRGYRERRQLQGLGLDASARWAEVGNMQCTMIDGVANGSRLYVTVSSSSSLYTAPS